MGVILWVMYFNDGLFFDLQFYFPATHELDPITQSVRWHLLSRIRPTDIKKPRDGTTILARAPLIRRPRRVTNSRYGPVLPLYVDCKLHPQRPIRQRPAGPPCSPSRQDIHELPERDGDITLSRFCITATRPQQPALVCGEETASRHD